MSEIKFRNCPICGKEVEVRGGDIDWKPTFYDPDSGGDPYYIHCECGLEFSIGYCDIKDLAKAWNTRKQMERIIERLEGKVKYYNTLGDESNFPSSVIEYGTARHYKNALKIVKEVGGIDV